MTRTIREGVAVEAWATMVDLVIDNGRKREVSEATGLSFGKVRALRRIAERPHSMGELASRLAMDPPNVTTMVDDLEEAGLVRRQPHHADRRVMLVTATAAGVQLAQRAETILDRPPEGISQLASDDLETLHRILDNVRGRQ